MCAAARCAGTAGGIVTAVFVKEPGIQVDRPTAETAFAPDGAAIFIAVSSQNEFWIDQRSVDLATASTSHQV